jgi:hypothetical protein
VETGGRIHCVSMSYREKPEGAHEPPRTGAAAVSGGACGVAAVGSHENIKAHSAPPCQRGTLDSAGMGVVKAVSRVA